MDGDLKAVEVTQDDAAMDLMIGRLLRTGVAVSATVIVAGAAMFLVRHGGERVDYHTFHELPHSLTSPVGIVRGALHGDSRSVIQAGMLLLIATPIARVVLAMVAFFQRRDLLYVAISGVVLLVLLSSFLLR